MDQTQLLNLKANMARQPIPSKFKDAPVSIGRGQMSPRLQALIATCTEDWTHVELHLALTLGSLLGVENGASVALFTALRNSRAQRDALHAAAATTLDNNLLEVFRAIMNVHSMLDSARNDIVHGVWGTCDTFTEGVVWTSLHDHAVMLITDYHAFSEPGQPLPGYNRSANILKNLYIWRYADIEDTVKSIGKLSEFIANFHGHLRYKSEPAGIHALHQLLSEPLIQSELAQMRSSAGRKR